ncbi:MAG: hypothetical protein U0640_07040 [Phycisphaerales bacterium]
MTQTWALFVDAYRDLNSKKLFWLSMVISALIVVAFAAIGIDEKGVSILWWRLGDFGGTFNSSTVPPSQFYKTMFVNFGIAFWLAWGATILAIISTAGLIPSFVQGGAVELVLSKPIVRVRLFLTKFVCGLLFSGLQVAVFSVACFLVIGLRGKSWEPAVFLAVPIVVIFYSYLYSICALIGLVTRSTIASLLLTILVWFALFLVNTTDGMLLMVKEANNMNIERLETAVDKGEKSATKQWQKMWVTKNSKDLPEGAPKPVPPTPTAKELDDGVPKLAEDRAALIEAKEEQASWSKWITVAVTAKTILPKTGETIGLLSRKLEKELNISKEDDDESQSNGEEYQQAKQVRPFGKPMSRNDNRELQMRVKKALEDRSVGWVIGTSLAFEAMILAIACWIFARRDF